MRVLSIFCIALAFVPLYSTGASATPSHTSVSDHNKIWIAGDPLSALWFSLDLDNAERGSYTVLWATDSGKQGKIVYDVDVEPDGQNMLLNLSRNGRHCATWPISLERNAIAVRYSVEHRRQVFQLTSKQGLSEIIRGFRRTAAEEAAFESKVHGPTHDKAMYNPALSPPCL